MKNRPTIEAKETYYRGKRNLQVFDTCSSPIFAVIIHKSVKKDPI
jgi:hypothetical protein